MVTAARALGGGNPSCPATSACPRGRQGHLRLGFPSENKATAHHPGPARPPSPVGNLSNMTREREWARRPQCFGFVALSSKLATRSRDWGVGRVLRKGRQDKGGPQMLSLSRRKRGKPHTAELRTRAERPPISLPIPSQSLKGTGDCPNAPARLAEGNVGGGGNLSIVREDRPRGAARSRGTLTVSRARATVRA